MESSVESRPSLAVRILNVVLDLGVFFTIDYLFEKSFEEGFFLEFAFLVANMFVTHVIVTTVMYTLEPHTAEKTWWKELTSWGMVPVLLIGLLTFYQNPKLIPHHPHHHIVKNQSEAMGEMFGKK